MSVQRSMTITGIGKVIARPNLIWIHMDIVTKDMDYDTAMDQAAIKHEQLRHSLVAIGIDQQDLKTIDFSINTNYITEMDRNANPRRIFDGYIIHHRLLVELYFDMKLLSTVIDAITDSKSSPEFQLRFTVQDRQQMAQEVLTDAVNNAMINANILARAAGVLLRNIVSMTYGLQNIQPFSPTQLNTAQEPLLHRSTIPLDIEPDDIEVSDTVTIVWEIVS